jgi:hypothetical protein
MFETTIDGREIHVKRREGMFTMTPEGHLIVERSTARELAEALTNSTSWTPETLEEDPE